MFTLDVGQRHVHFFVAREQPDTLRSMVMLEDGQNLALADIPPGTGLSSLAALQSVQARVLEVWRDQQ